MTATTEDRELWPGPDAPLLVARRLYREFRGPADLPTLRCWRGDWWRWTGQQWDERDVGALRSTVYKRLGQVDYDKPVRKNGEIDHYERTHWNPNRVKVANVLEALAAVAHLDAGVNPPAWIAAHDTDAAPGQVVACTNGLLSLADRRLHDPTPAFFNQVAVPFAYDAAAPEPVEWLHFLNSVWPGDADSIALLRQWLGYIISGRTDMQKILFIVGPSRSGKGTIARLLRQLVGAGNIVGPTLASLGGQFGLAPLLGKSLAVIADARLGGPAHVVVERLLSVSGEDTLTVDRKFREPWSGALGTRLMVLSNELPRFTDASGAIANRLLVLQMRQSFLGKEDRGLDAKLAAELPGILNWALAGLDELAALGKFTVPASSDEATTMLMDLASPTSAFIRDECVRAVGEKIETATLYQAWKAWCETNGHEPGANATFGRNLRAAAAEVRMTRHRDGEKFIRYYTGIALQPGTPGTVGESAGKTGSSVPGNRDCYPAHSDTFDWHPADCAGHSRHTADDNPQVNEGVPGVTGESAFKGQHKTPPGGITAATPGMTDRVATIASKHNAADCRCGAVLTRPESIAAGQCLECAVGGDAA